MGNDKHERPKNNQSKSLFSRSDTGNGNPFNWNDIPAGRLAGLISLISSRGGAVRFGYSRDGQAGSIGVYYGEYRDTLWIRPGSTGEDIIDTIELKFQSLPDTGGKSVD